MSLKSTPTQYGAVAASLHWLIAALALVALGSGFLADAIGAAAHTALSVHAMAGALAALLTIVRIVWRRLDKQPLPAPNTNGAAGLAARIVHVLLFLIPLGMAASGVGMILISGAAETLIQAEQTPLPEFAGLPPRAAHGVGARLLIAAIGLHAAAALYHHYVLRDGLLRRMPLFGRG